MPALSQTPLRLKSKGPPRLPRLARASPRLARLPGRPRLLRIDLSLCY
jgi:hypothetical protein